MAHVYIGTTVVSLQNFLYLRIPQGRIHKFIKGGVIKIYPSDTIF